MANFSGRLLELPDHGSIPSGGLLSRVIGCYPVNAHRAGESSLLLGMCPPCFSSPVSLLFQGLQPVYLSLIQILAGD